MKQAAYPSYKPTGVDWLEDVPSHWDMKRLRFAVQTNPLASELRCPPDTLVSFVPMDAVGEYGGLALDQEKALDEIGSGYTYFRDNDVVVAKITPCFENGKGALATGLKNGIAFGTTELHVLRSRDDMDPGFLFYLTISDAFRDLGEAHMYGAGGQKRVPDAFIKNLRSPIPPIDEQRAITRFLNEEVGRIDGLIAKKKELSRLLDEQKDAVVERAVTLGVKADRDIRPADLVWIDRVPSDWEVKRIKHLAKLKSGEAITSLEMFEEGKFPVFGGNGVRGRFDRYTHDGEFVLIGRQGALCGNINYATGKFWASEHAVVANPNLDFNTKWFGELLRIMNLNQYSVAAAQPGLAVENVARLFIPVPPRDEQDEIAEHIESETDAINRVSEGISAAIKRLIEYRAAIITAAVTGKIKVV
ncbi:restriction endonuclease subunit S [Paracoccus sp. APAP_BH8]|uniref:restriction endonuclease subunit S n=1 Tax=Paracoccus sp. APAP_BH8 TaxID=3110237 RepID=UPI002FD7DED6